MRRRFYRLIALLLLLGICFPVLPVGAVQTEQTAELLSQADRKVEYEGIENAYRLFDTYTADFAVAGDGGKLRLSSAKGIGSLYIRFGREYGIYSVTNEKKAVTRTWGRTGILHEFLDLESAFGEAPESVTISFDSGAAYISELYIFGPGQAPDFVQKWEAPADGAADLVLFSTHGDDEQLFFGGLIPYYAKELDYRVQVVYMTDHRNHTLQRVGEMLDGLWASGLRIYPVFGSFDDVKTGSIEETYYLYGRDGITEENVISFVVENIRRFRPKVAVGHDLEGEYGHGMHMVYAKALCEAVQCAGDAEAYPASAERYGVWDVPKTYLHLYPENKVVMDWDIPLQSFDGMTAFEVTRDLGFPCHVSQQDYYRWYYMGKNLASEITRYSPREYGLFRSTVGEDTLKNDLFENVAPHERNEEPAE